MKVMQILIAGIWIIIMFAISEGNNLAMFLAAGTFIVFLFIFFLSFDDKDEPVKAKNILIKYKDGNKEECMGTDWSRYNDHISFYNSNLEETLVKEVSADCVKSIGFSKGRVKK